MVEDCAEKEEGWIHPSEIEDFFSHKDHVKRDELYHHLASMVTFKIDTIVLFVEGFFGWFCSFSGTLVHTLAYYIKFAWPIKFFCYLMMMLGDAAYAIDAILQEHREGAVLSELVAEMKAEKEGLLEEEIRQSMLQGPDSDSSSSEESPKSS